jgi:hypothetical protein
MVRSVVSLAALLLLAGTAPTAVAQNRPEDARLLSLEVAALYTLHHLDLDAGQMQELLRLSKGCAGTLKAPGQTRITPAFSKVLTALRDALLADDSDRIDSLKENLMTVMEEDKIVMEDRVSNSAAARRQSAAAVRLLRPAQVLAKLDLLDDQEVDPLDTLNAALERGKNAGPTQWKQVRDAAAADAAWLIAGNDETKADPLAKHFANILDQLHTKPAAKGPKMPRPSLDKQVQQWTTRLDAFDILRHAMQREMAELLSNPRLPHVLQQKLAATREN